MTGGGGGQDNKEGKTGQETVYDESRAGVSFHGFWKGGTTSLFEMLIVNLYAVSYLCHTSAEVLATAEKEEEKDNYIKPCLERQQYSTSMVYSADGIPKTEAVAAQKRLASLLINKTKQEYWEMCGFVSARMSLAIVISNTILLRGSRYKEAYIRQVSNLEYGAVMALMAPWRG